MTIKLEMKKGVRLENIIYALDGMSLADAVEYLQKLNEPGRFARYFSNLRLDCDEYSDGGCALNVVGDRLETEAEAVSRQKYADEVRTRIAEKDALDYARLKAKFEE